MPLEYEIDLCCKMMSAGRSWTSAKAGLPFVKVNISVAVICVDLTIRHLKLDHLIRLIFGK